MKRMTYTEFAQVREAQNMRLIDVREPAEFDEVHVHGAELFPLSRLRNGEVPVEDERQLVLICRSGARSAMAANHLEAQGFREIINIDDGTMGAIPHGADHVKHQA